MLGSIHLAYKELGRYKNLLQGKGKKIGSEDDGTNWDVSLTAGVFASADVTRAGSQICISAVAHCRLICCAQPSTRERQLVLRGCLE